MDRQHTRIKSDSALDTATAISCRDASPMYRISMCPTAFSPSVKTAQSPATTCASSDRSSRSRVPKPVPILSTSSKQKVSARTGVSMNRLEGPTNNRLGAQLSDNPDVRTATEVSLLEDSAPTAILWDSDSMMTARSTSFGQYRINTATTQLSMTASHLDSASRGASRGHRSRTPGRHTPATNRTGKSTSTPSTAKTSRSMVSTTSRGRSMSRGTPNGSQPISTARPYSTNCSSMSPYRPPGAAPTHVYPNQQARGQPLGSISQAPLLPSLTGCSSGHPTALEISDNEAIGRGIGRALTEDNSGSSTSRKHSANRSAKKTHPNKKPLLRTPERLGTPAGPMYGSNSAAKKPHLYKKVNLPKPPPQDKSMIRAAKKARPCRKFPIPEPRSQTSQDFDSTSTYATTNYNELSAGAVSAAGTMATTLLDPGKRREHHRQCHGCGKPRASPSAQKKPLPAENPSVQVFQTNDGLLFRVKMRLGARELIKTGNSASTARFGATASACLPAGVEAKKAIIKGNVYQPHLHPINN
ncbi:unnamed protein product, partial [Mesorhabditis belari]|uniref:Uncharacterized protein n=1 Tax=Mesorhabditis belari TaxID=2138241 RepID=A0AAF3J4E4_9BILA